MTMARKIPHDVEIFANYKVFVNYYFSTVEFQGDELRLNSEMFEKRREKKSSLKFYLLVATASTI